MLIRTQILLASGFPETIAGPGFLGPNASSFRSSRRFAWRIAGSGPWHLKQLSDRMGRISRIKSTGTVLLDWPNTAGAAAIAAAERSNSGNGPNVLAILVTRITSLISHSLTIDDMIDTSQIILHPYFT